MYKFKLKISILMIAAAFASTASANHLSKKDKHVNNEIVVSPINHDFQVQLNKFDPALYQLAYQIFLQNNNIKDAFAIAVAAVKQQPNNLDWRQKLLTVSMWNAEPVVALDSYLYLATNFKDQSSLIKGTDLARNIHEDGFLAKFLDLDIKNGKSGQELWSEYLDSLTLIGELQTGIDQLNAHKNELAPEFYLTKLIELQRTLNNLEQEKKALLQYQKKIGSTPFSTVQENTINLTTADVKRSFHQLHSASLKAQDNDFRFWQAYAPITWLNDINIESIRSYKKLLLQTKPAEEVFERLITLYINQKPQIAYYYALQGISIYPDNLSFYRNALILAMELGKWDDIKKIWKNSPRQTKNKLNKDPEFWSVMLRYWEQRAGYYDRIWRFNAIVKSFPDELGLRAQYVSFLIDDNHTQMLAPVMTSKEKDFYLSSELWEAYALGYLHLHNPAMVFEIAQLYKSQFLNYKNDTHWLVDYKGFLEQIFYSETDIVKRYAWSVFCYQLHYRMKFVDYGQLIDFAKLAVDLDPGDDSLELLAKLEKNLTPEIADLMLSWALAHENYALADAIRIYYLKMNWVLSPQLALDLALYHNENYLIRDLLIKHASVVASNDRVQAAEQIGARPLAQDLAYQSLAEQPHNSDFYDKNFTPLMLRSSSNFNFNQQYFQYGAEEGPRTKVEFSYPITPGIMLTPYGSVWLLQDISTTQLATVPDKDLRTGIKALIAQPHGDLFVDVGYRDNLDSFATAKIVKTYAFSNDLTGLFTAGYNQQADDTAPLLIGGMKDELSANLNYQITSKDILQGSYYQNLFYTQNGQWLALGQQQTLNYKHLFWESYPDFSMEAYGSGYQYEDRAGTVTGNAANLVPADTTPDSNFFIPANFIEYGITAEFGQNYHEDYTYRIRPFAAVTLMESTTAGFGTLYNVGIGGSVFGKDHLALYYEEANNQGSGINKERIFEFMYQIYF